MLRPYSLRFELIVSLALLVAAASGLMGLVVFKYTQREMLALKVETALVLVKTVEERVNTGAGGRELLPLIRVLSQTGFESLMVMDRGGNTLASYGPWSPEGRPTAADLRAAAASGQMETWLGEPRLLPFGPEPTLALAAPLFSGPRVVGAVGLYSPLGSLRESWSRTKMIIFVYLGFNTLIIVLFGVYLVSRRFVGPLRHMVRRIEALAQGEFNPVETRAEEVNEISRLEEAFDRMAVTLLRSQARLEENLTSLGQAQEDLVRSEKLASVGRLAAGLAHELGNPLGSLLGFVHLLRSDDLSLGERADFLERMEGELARMDGIIRALLDFARPAPARLGPVDLSQAVEDALALAGVQKWFTEVKVAREIEPGLPPVLAEENRLTQVLLNLLANAGQAMNGSGGVTISAGRREDGVFVAVADTGPGIPAEDLPHVFEPFFTRKEPGQGTGLGLSVSLSIVESFGGRLEVASRPGEGSVFTVVLAAAPGMDPRGASAAQAEEP
ncbi:MAG: ATP-binding protein [Thermodesulfobacteriota bacterium]